MNDLSVEPPRHGKSKDIDRAVLYVNAKSRRGQEWFTTSQAALRDKGVELADARMFRDVRDLQRATQRAIADGTSLVVIGGGDGTFSSVARYFVGSSSTLGVLPLGTGNAFARDLGIVADVQTAVRTILEGREARVDLGFAGDDYFLNVASIGLTTRIAEALTGPMKKRLGRFVYAVALV